MFETLRSLVGRRRGHRELVRECRNCGTSVERDVECPCCGCADIVRYEIE